MIDYKTNWTVLYRRNFVENKQWKKLLSEGLMLTETVDFLNKPTDDTQLTKVQLTLERKVDGKTAWYRLETDGWFRRYMQPGKGYGILLRTFKITGAGKHNTSPSLIQYPVIVTYTSLEYSGEVDWDNPKYLEKAKGTLMIRPDKTDAKVEDVGRFVNQQIQKGTYKP